MELSTKDKELLQIAQEAAKQAYAPYSGYHVGAALRCLDGSVVTGCNVENSSYSLTLCAERNAVFKAISEGKRDYVSIAIYVEAEQLFPPCGACRQVMYEFNPQLRVIYANPHETIVTSLSELLPGAFTLRP